MRHSLREVVTGCGLVLLGLTGAAVLFSEVWATRFPPSGAAGIRLGLMIFLGSFLVISLIAAAFQAVELKRPFLGGWGAAVYWMGRWLGWVGLAVAAGGVLGALVFYLAGICFTFDRTLAELVKQGVRDGAFYFLVWAPGGAAVICLMEARARSHRKGTQTA